MTKQDEIDISHELLQIMRDNYSRIRNGLDTGKDPEGLLRYIEEYEGLKSRLRSKVEIKSLKDQKLSAQATAALLKRGHPDPNVDAVMIYRELIYSTRVGFLRGLNGTTTGKKIEEPKARGNVRIFNKMIFQFFKPQELDSLFDRIFQHGVSEIFDEEVAESPQDCMFPKDVVRKYKKRKKDSFDVLLRSPEFNPNITEDLAELYKRNHDIVPSDIVDLIDKYGLRGREIVSDDVMAVTTHVRNPGHTEYTIGNNQVREYRILTNILRPHNAQSPNIDAIILFMQLVSRASMNAMRRDTEDINQADPLSMGWPAIRDFSKQNHDRTLMVLTPAERRSIYERMELYSMLGMFIDKIKDSAFNDMPNGILEEIREYLQERANNFDLGIQPKVETIFVPNLLPAGQDDEQPTEITADFEVCASKDGMGVTQEQRIQALIDLSEKDARIMKCIVMRDEETRDNSSHKDFAIVHIVAEPSEGFFTPSVTQFVIPSKPNTATFILKGDDVQDFERPEVQVTHAELRDWPYVQTGRFRDIHAFISRASDFIFKPADELQPASKRNVRWKGNTKRRSQAIQSLADYVYEYGYLPLVKSNERDLIMHGRPKNIVTGERSSLYGLCYWQTLHRQIKAGKVLGWEDAVDGIRDQAVLDDLIKACPDLEIIRSQMSRFPNRAATALRFSL